MTGGLVLFLVSLHAGASPRLETVIVQGERAQRLIGETTTLVGIIAQEDLRSGAVEHANQIFNATPGIWVSRGNGQEHLTAIRSPVFTGAGACGAFAMLEDGIAVRAAGFCNANQLFDSHLEWANYAEVLKGPHSSLMGGNAQFGAINTQLPLAADVVPQVRLSGSTEGYRRVGAAQAGNLHRHHVGVLATAIEDDGMQADSGLRQQKISLRHNWSGNQWLSVENGVSLMNLEQETAGYIEGEDAYKDDTHRKLNDYPEAYRDADSLRAYSRWRYREVDREWTFTPYLRHNQMAFLMHFVPWKPVEQNAHDSLGWQFHWRRYLPRGGELFIAHEAERTWGELSEIQYSPAPFSQAEFPVGTHYDYKVTADSASLSAGGFGYLTDALAVDAAVRLDYTRYDYTNQASNGMACTDTVSACRFYRPESQSSEFFEPSAHIGVVSQWINDRYWFAKISTGFRLPQVTELYRAQSPQQTEIDEERIYAVEAGLRGQSGPWVAQVSLFAMRNYDGIIQNPDRQYINGVKSRHQGLEYDVTFENASWYLHMSGQYADHEYRNDPDLLGNNVPLYGNQMDTAPAHVHSFTTHYRLSDSHRFGMKNYWLGEHYLDPQNEYRYEGHFLLDLDWAWQYNASFSSTLSVLNALDRRYAERADVGFGEYRYFPGLERRLSLALTYEF